MRTRRGVNNISVKKISLFAVIADSAFAAACAFAVIFTAVRFYARDSALGLALGAAAAVLIGALAFLRLSSRRSACLTSSRARSRRQAFRAHLCSLPESRVLQLVQPALGGRITPAGIESGGALYIADFMPQALSPNDICRAIAAETAEKKIIMCNDATEEAVRFARSCGAETLFADDIFSKLESLDALPEHYADGKAARPSVKAALKDALKRANFGRLFRCGLWLTAFSYFTFLPAYYIAAGTIMLALAAVCLIFGKRG